jgi:hypothetical protein
LTIFRKKFFPAEEEVVGAIFNTPGTIKILNFLNKHYAPGAKFNHARSTGEYKILRDFATYPSSYSCAVKLGLEDTSASINARWKLWLDYLDSQSQDFSNAGQLVREMMADALDPAVEPSCDAIEFFAVPASSFSVEYPAPTIPDPNNPNNYAAEIIVETNTIDTMRSFAKTQGKG